MIRSVENILRYVIVVVNFSNERMNVSEMMLRKKTRGGEEKNSDDAVDAVEDDDVDEDENE